MRMFESAGTRLTKKASATTADGSKTRKFWEDANVNEDTTENSGGSEKKCNVKGASNEAEKFQASEYQTTFRKLEKKKINR